ncbi:MAG: L-threonylcarbamoyladenylate synthase [Cyclobacteriaceae bacterium]|jgi:L-threonylcarbamoyladenylate synthase
MAESGKDIEKAKSILQQDGLVAIPTETVYGLAANAFSEEAVVKIFEVKNRPSFDPLIVHVDSIEQAEDMAENVPEKAKELAGKFWPGPLTILLKKKAVVPDMVTSGLSTVAIRIPDHPLTLDLLNTLGFPLAAPSANPFGYVSPTSVKHVNDQLGDKIPYILDGGDCDVGIESTIIGFINKEPEIFRLGGIPVEDIETIVGKVLVKLHSSSRPEAPGLLESHYAPLKKVKLRDNAVMADASDPGEIGLIRFKEIDPAIPEKNQIILSRNGDLMEAAKNLFSALRKMDEMDVKYVVAESLPEKGLGRAINDRLRRAAAVNIRY